MAILKIVICDDNNKQEHAHLYELCREYQNTRNSDIVCSSFYSGVDLISELKGNDYDVILLKVDMRGYSGIQAASEIRLFNHIVKIILLHNASETVMDSDVAGTCDYLLKPVTREQLFPLLEKIQAEIDSRSVDSLVVKCREGIVRIRFSHIEFVEVMNKRVSFHLIDGSVQDTSASLLEFEPQLLSRVDFFKVHRSFLINLHCVQTLSMKGIITPTGHTIPISKALYSQAKEAYMKYLFISRPKAPAPTAEPKPIAPPTVKSQGGAYRVLLVDDEAGQQDYWSGVLREKGCTVDLAINAEAAMQLASKEVYDCIVLDVMLFGESSFSHCVQLRELMSTPIVFLSSLTDSDSQLQGFLSGGIDYITKDTPADLFWVKIEARIRLSRTGKVQLTFDSLVMNLSLRKVLVDGVELVMTPTEFDLLWLLAEHDGRVYTPEELYHAVWGSSQWDGGQSIQVHLSRMRRKLEKACPSHCFIETAWGKGYRFVSSRENAADGEETNYATV